MRDDLAALTPESVAALTNLGLVKRALKEIDAGKGPQLAEADGTVTGTFDDGVVAKLPPNQTLKDAPCTCGAAGACRHKVAVALAYKAWASPGPGAFSVAPGFQPGGALPVAPAFQPGAPPVAWNPGDVDEGAILAALGSRATTEAQNLRRRGVVVEIRHGATPTAKLPTCTVRFLVPNDLAYARCDCQIGQNCAHVAIAVWAFRGQPEDRTVEVRDAASSGPGDVLEPAARLAADLVLDGVTGASPALGQRFAVVREALISSGYVWPATLLEDVEAQLDAYRARSARYSSGAMLRLLSELAVRRRATVGGGELPARHVLGTGEAMETKLDLLRLVSLGVRVEADGRARTARVLLADPDTTTVLVVEKTWTFADGEEIPDGPGLAGRRVAANVGLGVLGRGQVVTKVARRRANGTVGFGAATGGAISITPQTGDWEALPVPIRQPGVAALLEGWAKRPPRSLRPRMLAENVHVLPVASVDYVAWDPGAQTLLAQASDPDGVRFRVAREFRAATPKAIDRIAEVLTSGRVRYVAGEVRKHLGAVEIDPSAIAADLLVVPDLDDATTKPDLPTGRITAATPALEARLMAAASALEEGVHLGMRGVSAGWPDRSAAVAKGLAEVGLDRCAERVRAVGDALRSARRDATPEAWAEVGRTWTDAAVRLELAREAL